MMLGFSFNGKKTINGTSELNQDLYLWVIQTIWDEEFNYTTEFVVNGQELKRPNYSKKIDFWMSFGGENSIKEQVSINIHHPMFTGNRNFNIKIGKIEDTTILDSIKEENSYNYNKLLKYSKENSSIFSDDLQTRDVAHSYYTEQDVLFDGATLLADEAYYYIYILLDDENGKYYPFEAVIPAKATVWDEGWYLEAVDSVIDNIEEQPTPEPEPTPQPDGEPTPEPEVQPTPESEKKPTNQPVTEDKTKDNTIAPGTMPYTGGTFAVIISILGIVFLGVHAYKRNKDLKGI